MSGINSVLGRMMFALGLCVFVFLTTPVLAEIVASGDVIPATDPSTWDEYTYAYIGKTGSGTLMITNGSEVGSAVGYLGGQFGATGVVTVNGSGSRWTNSGWAFYVGHYGSGALNITNGGLVDVSYKTLVAIEPGSEGEIHFDGGTLTTGSLLAGADQLTGTGTINTHGLISDFDLVFDSADDLTQTITYNSLPGQNITINLGVDGTPLGAGTLGAGYAGNGSLSILNGVQVFSNDGYIGYKPGSMGVVTVDGAGSRWMDFGGGSYVGFYGSGTLNITNCGQVISDTGFIGYYSGSMGVVTVDGAGSTWDTGGTYVGWEGSGTLNITNGGTVDGHGGWIGGSSGSTGVVTVNGAGSTWNTGGIDIGFSGSGTLNITNGGVVNGGASSIGRHSGSTGVVTVDGAGSTWTYYDSGYLSIGDAGSGTLNITNGGMVSINYGGRIGDKSGSTGVVTVDGAGSLFWAGREGSLSVGCSGSGTLNITNGGKVFSVSGTIGHLSSTTGVVTVDGSGSAWICSGGLIVGYDEGRGTLDIINGGLVCATGLTIDWDGDGNSYINLASGGRLAILGQADDSLADFLALVQGTDAIRYWDNSISDWSDITGATMGEDYWLSYITEGDLTGYTVLTVGVPEPATLSLLGLGAVALLRRRN